MPKACSIKAWESLRCYSRERINILSESRTGQCEYLLTTVLVWCFGARNQSQGRSSVSIDWPVFRRLVPLPLSQVLCDWPSYRLQCLLFFAEVIQDQKVSLTNYIYELANTMCKQHCLHRSLYKSLTYHIYRKNRQTQYQPGTSCSWIGNWKAAPGKNVQAESTKFCWKSIRTFLIGRN